MKKSMIFAMCAFAFAFASCEQNGGSDVPAGELEQSYVAITLASPDLGTRADDGFAEGEDEERYVHSAYVFFYDEAGKAFNVTAGVDGVVSQGGATNYMALSLNKEGSEPNPVNNISDVKNSVVILNNYKGVYPSQVVAVLNFNPASVQNIHTLTIAQLQKELIALGDKTTGFVMSNSVYADAAGQVVGTPLSAANIASTPAAAVASPVKIYVERIAAKVDVKVNGDVDVDGDAGTVDHMYTLSNTYINGLGVQQVYAKVLGWELSNYKTSSLLKEVDPEWTLGFDWLGDFRSYWAVTNQTTPVPTVENVDTITNFNPIYTGENTTANAAEVIIRAQLCTYNSTERKYVPCELAKWYGYEYVGKGNLIIGVRNFIANTYYYLDGSSYIAIGTDDIMTVEGDGNGAQVYEVYFQLSKEANKGENREWYVRENGQFVAKTDAEINTALASIQPALLYAGGFTYYHTPIVHKFTDPVTKGVVRNHIYQINVNSIKGYGTPITYNNVVTPVTPPLSESYVAAEINILSWRTVTYDVDIK